MYIEREKGALHLVVHFSVYSNKDIKKWIGLFEEKKAYVLADGVKYDSSTVYKAFPHIHCGV